MPDPMIPSPPSPAGQFRPPTPWTRFAGAGALVAVG